MISNKIKNTMTTIPFWLAAGSTAFFQPSGWGGISLEPNMTVWKASMALQLDFFVTTFSELT